MARRYETPEQRERERLRSQARFARDPAKHRAATKASRAKAKAREQADPALYEVRRAADKARQQAWRETPKGKASAKLHTNRRRARLKDLRSPGVTVEQWEDICCEFADEQGNVRCAYCGKAGRMTVDHIYPLVKGGLDEASNVLPACLSCNSSKSDRLVVEWERGRRMLTPAMLSRLASIVYPPRPGVQGETSTHEPAIETDERKAS